MQYAWRILFWLAVGTLTGFGVIAAASIGLPFVLAGAVLAVYGFRRFGSPGCWVGLVSIGGVPALLLFHDVLTAGPRCPANGVLRAGQSCTDVSSYPGLARTFGAIAAIGGTVAALAELAITRLRIRLKRSGKGVEPSEGPQVQSL